MKFSADPGHYVHFSVSLGTRQVGEFQLRFPVDSKVIELWSFEVYKSHRGKGYAHRMMREILHRAKTNTQGRMFLVLHVKKSNYKAVRLYEAHGFVVAAYAAWSGDYTMSRFV